ncbi:ComF family protein [Streptomyces sp. NPDC101145]|uniref:ComF family protein n=1 Tax=Streptomyces sp. NPDC101145 TaxID=3366112 RepID=UPI00382AF5A8
MLRQRRKVTDQAALDARQRHENLAGALEVVPGGMRLLEGACAVLVDDLMTTGASLTEAARALYEAGAARVAAAEAAPPGVEWPSGPAEAGSAGAGQVWTGSAEAGHARTGSAEAGHARTGTGAGPAGVCGPAESPGAVGAVGGGCRIADGGEGRAFGGNGGESRRVHGTFGAAYTPFGPGRGELPRGDHGAVLIGAAVVAASPKAFGINRN